MKIKLDDKEFELSLPARKIQLAVQNIANKMNADLYDKDVVFLSILNGSFMFAADLLKLIKFKAKISFLKFASYEGTKSTGTVKQLIGLNEDLSGKTVVVLEDIVDTGITAEGIIKQLEAFNPAEIKLATLLFKPDAFKKDYPIDYIGLKIPNDFIVGYGLDYNGYGRNLDAIYTYEKPEGHKPADVKYFLLFGPPGAGKGTQSKQITQICNFIHLSTGDLLRKELECESELGLLAKSYMNKGDLVPDDVILGMVANELDANKTAKGIVLDGFPRTVEQAEALDALLAERNGEVSAMISLCVRKKELVRRLLERAKIENRIDDTPEIIEKRIKNYEEQTLPVSEYFRKQGKLYEIAGKGDIEDVFEDISRIISKQV